MNKRKLREFIKKNLRAERRRRRIKLNEKAIPLKEQPQSALGVRTDQDAVGSNNTQRLKTGDGGNLHPDKVSQTTITGTYTHPMDSSNALISADQAVWKVVSINGIGDPGQDGENYNIRPWGNCKFKIMDHPDSPYGPGYYEKPPGSGNWVADANYFANLGISDVRLKENIKRTGISNSGIPIYTFNYKNDNTLWSGTMAQDLLSMGIKEAVVTMDNGYYGVNYNKIDINFKKLC